MELHELRALVDRALADGCLTQVEMDQIMDAIMEDGVVSADESKILDMIESKMISNEIQLG
ncbi:MAG: hypothetical protein NW237_05990 [Cyanobacteriota bacterium]|nr:hypothetical protein [Cyanobacteriota bacterium]